MLSSDSKYFIKLFLSKRKLPKTVVGYFLLLSSSIFHKAGNYWIFSKILGKYEKLYEQEILKNNSCNFHKSLVNSRKALIAADRIDNAIYASFKKSAEANSILNLYKAFSEKDRARIRYQNEDKPNREGNLLVLQEFDSTTNTKGVLYLQYNQSILEFSALFNLPELYKHYILIVEPSSWGYSNIGLELLLHKDNPVFVMAQDEIDFNLCLKLDSRIIPIRAGAGDWINTAASNHLENQEKIFDVCMVASWRKLKNHKLMFRQLSTLGPGLKIALVGYPWENRTAASIRQEQDKYYPNSLVSIFESVPHEYVFRVLAQSRVALMLSEREGANRGIYEALSSNIPVIMLDSNRGVNKNLINEGCIIPSAPQELANHVSAVINSSALCETRKKLLSISGTQNTWNKIKLSVLEHTGIMLPEASCITSTPNLRYLDENIKTKMDTEFLFLESLLTKY